MKLTFNKVFFFLLTLVWAVLLICNLSQKEKTVSDHENRVLASLPKFSEKTLLNGDYMTGLEEYVNDQFVFRDDWITVKTAAERLLGKTDSGGVYFGKDHCLLAKYTVVDEARAGKNRDLLSSFAEQAVQTLGADRVRVMLVPTASEILKDKLPPFAAGYDQKAYCDSIKAALPEGTFLDVASALEAHSQSYIYYRTDPHWTSLGAYYGYLLWAKDAGFSPLTADDFDIVTASDAFYGTLHSRVNIRTEADTLSLYERRGNPQYTLLRNQTEPLTSLYDPDALNGKDQYSVYLGGNDALLQIDTENKNGRRLLILKDSFANCFVPFVVEHFSQTHVIDLRYFNLSVRSYMEEHGITDVLVLYNTMNFAEDRSFVKLSKP